MAANKYLANVEMDEFGTISIAPVESSTAGDELGAVSASRLDVSGAVLTMSISDPELRISAVIDRPSVAGWWVGHLFGEDIGVAVSELADLGEPAAREVSAVVTDLAEVTSRLMLGFWLRRWRPSATSHVDSIREWVLDAELGELAWFAEELLGGIAAARELFESTLPGVSAELSEALTTDAGRDPATDPVLGLAISAGRASLDTLWTDSVGYDSLARLVAAIENREQGISDALDSIELAVGSSVESKSSYDLVAGDGERDNSLAEGHTDVDWNGVHPRSVDADSRAVRWTVSEEGGERWIRVVVRAEYATFRTAVGFMFARVLIPGSDTLGVALDRVGSQFEGRAWVPRDVDLDTIRVDIRSDEYATRRSSSEEAKRTFREALGDWFLRRRQEAPTIDGLRREFVAEADARVRAEKSAAQ
ncbi:MAG: hypothetical protein ABI400_07380 [Lacisediminihabitans sp.]